MNKKLFVIGAMFILLGVALVPSINANVVENELVEFTTKVCGLSGIESHTIQLIKEEAEEVEIQKELILKKILTPEAKARITSLKLVNPQLATQIESLLLYLNQSGQIKGRITDEQLKSILIKIKSSKKETKIKRV